MAGSLLNFKYYPWVTHGGFIPTETHRLHVPIPIETHTHAVGIGFYEYGYGYALRHPWVIFHASFFDLENPQFYPSGKSAIASYP